MADREEEELAEEEPLETEVWTMNPNQIAGILIGERNPPPLPAMKQAHKQYPDPRGVALILQI